MIVYVLASKSNFRIFKQHIWDECQTPVRLRAHAITHLRPTQCELLRARACLCARGFLCRYVQAILRPIWAYPLFSTLFHKFHGNTFDLEHPEHSQIMDSGHV